MITRRQSLINYLVLKNTPQELAAMLLNRMVRQEIILLGKEMDTEKNTLLKKIMEVNNDQEKINNVHQR